MGSQKNKNLSLGKREFKKFLCIFVLTFALIFVGFNFEAIYKNIKYELDRIFSGKTSVIGESEIVSILKENSGEKSNKDNLNILFIPKISVQAPILIPTSISNRDTLNALKNGVALYPHYALPGRRGMTIISGHSSPNIAGLGKYNTVFALLGKLEHGDKIIIYYSQKEYHYKVIRKFVFAPNKEFSKDESNNSNLLLISCWPIGTNFKRIGVEAELIP